MEVSARVYVATYTGAAEQLFHHTWDKWRRLRLIRSRLVRSRLVRARLVRSRRSDDPRPSWATRWSHPAFWLKPVPSFFQVNVD